MKEERQPVIEEDFKDHSAGRIQRQYPAGAELVAEGVSFRVWAPESQRVRVGLAGRAEELHELRRDGASGYFSAVVPDAEAGMDYFFRLDDDAAPYPDPASRFQPEGPMGPSRIVDGRRFEWTDARWNGAPLKGQIVYELHVGTFTQAGTWESAAAELSALASLGISAIELMPVADFAGGFGWGYDGVNLFAPSRLYGTPDDMRRFVDRAHALGIAVVLDVVYNHVGASGNYLPCFAKAYFTDRYECEWGAAFNFDGRDSGPVREYFIANARYWIEEFHLDGLRLDATQQLYDASPEHIMAAVARAVREAAGPRSTILIGENEPQDTRLIRSPAAGGYGLDALWNDDFHHSAHVALTSRNEAYYSDHLGSAQEFISAAKWGYLFQGQRYAWQKKPRGTPALDLEPASFVNFLDNHDQIANSGRGQRIHQVSAPGAYRALTALLLLLPGTPMLFMGQEYAAPNPFLYFADNDGSLAESVHEGRKKFLRQFPSLGTPGMQERIPLPSSRETFEQCKLRAEERSSDNPCYRLHRDLIRLRREHPFDEQRKRGVDGAVLGPDLFVLRFFGRESADRLLIVNLGRDAALESVPEPLMAPVAGHGWEMQWNSEDPAYGGIGMAPVDGEEGWRFPGKSAVVLRPKRNR